MAWAVKTIPISLLLAGISYGQECACTSLALAQHQPALAGLARFPAKDGLFKHGRSTALL